MKIKYLLIIIGILAFGILIYYVGWSFSPGSYGKAENYELNTSEKTLIEIINQVKSENNLNTNKHLSLNGFKSWVSHQTNDFIYSVYNSKSNRKVLVLLCLLLLLNMSYSSAVTGKSKYT